MVRLYSVCTNIAVVAAILAHDYRIALVDILCLEVVEAGMNLCSQ